MTESTNNNQKSFAEITEETNKIFETSGNDFIINNQTHPEVISGFVGEILAELENN